MKRDLIKTDETGYVWMDCEHYSLPDNSQGKIGYHVFYRPLCGTMYKGNETVTESMMNDIRAHYAAIEVEKDSKKAIPAAVKVPYPPDQVQKRLCPKCGTFCYGDCDK